MPLREGIASIENVSGEGKQPEVGRKEAENLTYSCSQNPMISSATAGDGSVNHVFNHFCPSGIVAACTNSGMLWQMSLKTFLACSGIGGLLEQYGRSAVAGLTVGIGACDWKSCRWNVEMVWLRAETEGSGMNGISRPEDRRLEALAGVWSSGASKMPYIA